MKTRTLRGRRARNKVVIALASALALLAAGPAQAQFDKYVALGDSLTAGFESNCLVQRNQVNSYPAVLARSDAIGE